MAKGRGQKVSRGDLAAIFGVSLPTVDTWVKSGCPFVERGGRGRAWTFDTADVAEWRRQVAADEAGGTDSIDEATITRRKKIAETKLVEMEFLQKAGALAPVGQMERAVAGVLSEVQSNLRGAFIARLVAQLLGEQDARTFKRVALSEVDAVLKSLAEMDITVDEPEGGDDA